MCAQLENFVTKSSLTLNHLSKFLHGQSDSVFTSSTNDIEPEKPSMIPVPIAPNVSALETKILPKRLQQFSLLIPLFNTSIFISQYPYLVVYKCGII